LNAERAKCVEELHIAHEGLRSCARNDRKNCSRRGTAEGQDFRAGRLPESSFDVQFNPTTLRLVLNNRVEGNESQGAGAVWAPAPPR
jgi:hypothetical protein